MNILFLINYAGNAGTEKYVENLERIFSAEGNTCFLGYNVEGKLSEDFEKRGIKALKLPLTSRDISSSSKILADYCRKNDIDVIHSQYPVENIIAVRSLKYYPKPKAVMTRHLSDSQGLKWTILNRIYTGKNHKIICVCDESKDALIKNGVDPKKIEVIYNGVEYNAEPKKNTVGETFNLVICARYSKEKGLDFLIESLSLLKKKTNKRFLCRILGDGEEFNSIKTKIAELGLESEVKQIGYTNDTKSYLEDSNLYLNSSKSEAMSVAILEAMNEGLPVVATNVGGNSTLVSKGVECGAVAEYGDADGYSNAILKYINDEQLLQLHSENANRKVKESFDLVKSAHKVYETYK